MSTEPRMASAPQLREVRAAARRQASTLWGGTMLVVGTLIVAAVMVLVVVLDYHFNQPIHRVIKFLLGAAAGAGFVLVPWSGLFIIPIAVPFLPWVPPIPVPGMNALNLLVGGVFASWAIPRVLRRQPIFRTSFLGKGMLILLVTFALAVIRGAAIPTGYTYDAFDAAVELFRVSMNLSIYVVTLSIASGARDRRAFTWAVILGLILESVTTIMYGRNGSGGRAIGSIGQSNDLGTYLALCTVPAASILVGTRNLLGRLVLLGAVILGSVGIVYSVSRASVLVVLLGFGYVALRSSRVLTLILLATLLTSTWWAPDYLKERVMGTQTEVEDTDEVELEGSAQARIDTWKAVVEVVSAHPLDGVGYVGLKYILPETGEAMGADVMDSSHNTYLSMLGGMGILGLGLFIWLLWRCWALGIAGERAAATRFDRQLAIGLTGATLALTVSCAFGDRFFSVVVTGPYWVICALVNDLVLERRNEKAA
jgi:O-antigen ligase